MSRIRLLGACLVAMFVLSAVIAGTAFAEEKTKMLPEAGVKFTGKGGEGKLERLGSANNVKCKRATGSGTIESANLGKYETDFKECTSSLGGNCTGSGEATGVILNRGTYHFWLAKELLGGVNTLVGALVTLPEEIHFTCQVIVNILVLVKGCVAALATPLNTLAAVTKDVFATSARGDQLITKVLPAGSTTEENCVLLSSENGGAFESASLQGTAENENFKSGETAVTVLLMNPEARE